MSISCWENETRQKRCEILSGQGRHLYRKGKKQKKKKKRQNRRYLEGKKKNEREVVEGGWKKIICGLEDEDD